MSETGRLVVREAGEYHREEISEQFTHGSDSSRHSPPNRYVAQVLREAGLATVPPENFLVTGRRLRQGNCSK